MEQMQEHETVMECSEEESVGEPEKNDEWENDERNQMDYEQEFAEESDQYEASSSVMEKPSEDLNEVIHAHKMQKQQLEEILKIQLENIVELQNVCEKILYTVEQIPALRELKLQRCNQVLSEIHDLKKKQSQLSELIDYTVQKYDEDLELVYSLKEEFDAQKQLNYERCTVFEADLVDLASTGTSFVSSINMRISQKRAFYTLLENHLAELKKAADAVDEVNAKIESMFENANALNLTLFENESELENLTKNSAEVKSRIELENSKFSQKMEDYKRKELEASLDSNILQGKIEKTRLDLEHMSAGNAESQSKLASLKHHLAELENDKQLKSAAKLALTFQLTELSDQQSTLSQTMSALTRCKNVISAGKNDIRSLETELDRLTSRSVDLENKRAEIAEQIVSYERYVQEAVDRTEALEGEFKKLGQELPQLRSSYTKETKEVSKNEIKTAEELSHYEAIFAEMNDSFNKLSPKLEQCQSKLSSLRQLKETLKDSIGKKRSSAIDNEETIKSVSEDLETCNAEWTVLCEQERTGLDTVNTVKSLTSELNERQNQLAHVIETTDQMLLAMNEENNRQIEEKVRETEKKKREHLKALEEQAKKGAKMEDEFKSLQSNASTFNILLKDACKQAELFGCEKSLFRTFAQWVFNDDSVEPSQDWVTSTSDALILLKDSQDPPSQDIDFKVKEVKKSYKQ